MKRKREDNRADFSLYNVSKDLHFYILSIKYVEVDNLFEIFQAHLNSHTYAHKYVCIFYAITSQIFRLFRRHCKLNIESNLKKNLHMRKGNKIGLSNEKLSKARIQ